jgi:hypothetical protein
MSGLIRETTPDAAARFTSNDRRRSYRSEDELLMRDAVERWGRKRWPLARVVHELVMDRGTVRADVAFVSPAHLAVVEIKSQFDDTSRLLHQVGMFRLATPEVWIAAPHRHIEDAKLIRYLMPSIGIALSDRDRLHGALPDDFELDAVHEHEPFQPWPEACLALLWVEELRWEAEAARLVQGKGRHTHGSLLKALGTLRWPEQLAAVCRQLRGRPAFWKADPPIAPDLTCALASPPAASETKTK